MTKHELMNRYNQLSEEKRIIMDGISNNSNKAEIENAINCLECSDDVMNEYLTVIKLKYPNIYKAIISNGDYRIHSYNRLHVYNSARVALNMN